MLTYRTFRNSDPPVLSSLWRSRSDSPWLLQPASPDLLEQLVFAKLYFDYDGLFLALDNGQPIGFAHAGFGPNDQATWISTDAGVVCMVLVRPEYAESEAALGLVERCEEYLRRRGAQTIYGGGLYPRSPFYLGLYNGSEPAGVLDADTITRGALAARGFREIERTVSLRCELGGGFESVMDRRQMQIRRQMMVEVATDAPTSTWWDASAFGDFELTQFDLVPRDGEPMATAVFRTLEPSGSALAGRGVGLVRLHVDESCRRRGLAVFLLSEALRQFLRQGIAQVNAQVVETNAAALGLFQKLGFQQLAQGGVWRKDE